MVRAAVFLSVAMLTTSPAWAAVLMDSAPSAPADRPVLPPSANGLPRGHVVIDNFGNTLKDDAIFASYDAAPAAVPAAPNVSAAPEPATWAMMLGGFVLAGAAIRRRAARALPSR